MKLAIMLLIFSTLILSTAYSAPQWISVGNDILEHAKHEGVVDKSIKAIKSDNLHSILEVDSYTLNDLSHIAHHDFKRCGGYVHHDSLQGAIDFLDGIDQTNKKGSLFNYTINQQATVNKLIPQTEEFKIAGTINKLSSFQNRYYKSPYGVQSQEWIKSHWEELSKHRSDVKVEFYNHSWAQPSVILTIEGSANKDEIIIMGGHADSIVGFFGGPSMRAPGADDNASGIASLTEILRILMENDFKPQRTIKFMAYAAEEVGLRGSKEIAKEYKNKGINVVGVMQLDMTNYKGSKEDIILIGDYTNASQNKYIGSLIDEYLQVPWGYSKCGYGCSDHAAWHANGYAASFPHEATFKESNKKIHTTSDTISISGDNAFHAVNFSKLGIAYVVEMSTL